MNVDEIRQLIVNGQVLSAEAVDQQIADWKEADGSDEDGDGFLGRLLENDEITEFHAHAIKAGISGPYKLGPYFVHDRVAAGRLGNIFRAIHEDYNQPVGLKIFPAELSHDSEQAARLARETRIAVQADHPNVVRTFQVGRFGEIVFLAIEDLQGETLSRALRRENKIPVFEACSLVREAAMGLAHLHSLGVILRDIQPSNLWVTSEGHTKLMEFGAARDALSYLDADDDDVVVTISSGELLGSYDFMSPEQGTDPHNADERSDIYALGCVLFTALTGDVVFPDNNPVKKMLRHAREEPRSVKDIDGEIPQGVADAVATMLAKEPDARYQRAEDVVWALDELIDEEEKHEAVAAEISPEFLEWANSTRELASEEDIPTVVADPEFIGFLDWMSEQEEEEP